MIIDELGVYKCEDGGKAHIKYICNSNDRRIAFGFYSHGHYVWDCSDGAVENGGGVDPCDIISKWQDPEIPLNVNWKAFPDWATGLKWGGPLSQWGYMADLVNFNKWTEFPQEYDPKPPYPPGYEDGRIFERPEPVVHPDTCTDEYCVFCHGVKKASQRPPEPPQEIPGFNVKEGLDSLTISGTKTEATEEKTINCDCKWIGQVCKICRPEIYEKTCEWSKDDDGDSVSACDMTVRHGHPLFIYCPWCAGRIVEKANNET